MKSKKLKKGNIFTDLSFNPMHKYWKVICVDSEYAVVAKSNKKGSRTDLTTLWVIPPNYTYYKDTNDCWAGNYKFRLI